MPSWNYVLNTIIEGQKKEITELNDLVQSLKDRLKELPSGKNLVCPICFQTNFTIDLVDPDIYYKMVTNSRIVCETSGCSATWDFEGYHE